MQSTSTSGGLGSYETRLLSFLFPFMSAELHLTNSQLGSRNVGGRS